MATAAEKLSKIKAIHDEVGESHSNRLKRDAWDRIGAVLAGEEDPKAAEEAPVEETETDAPVETQG